MHVQSLIQYALFLGLVTVLVRPARTYLLAVFHGRENVGGPISGNRWEKSLPRGKPGRDS
jgi:hypothetical protein